MKIGILQIGDPGPSFHNNIILGPHFHMILGSM